MSSISKHRKSVFRFFDATPSYNTSDVFFSQINPEIFTSEELLRALYYSLWFPGYFGFNWDALSDCLRDFTWMPFCKIIIAHRIIPRIPREDLEIYLSILHDAVIDWSDSEEHELEVIFSTKHKHIVEEIISNTKPMQ